MGALIVSLGGGGGASSDECTATANDILKGARTINRNSDDEIVEGTLELTGNAQAAHVLENETFYTTDAHSQQKGNMKNIGSIDEAKSVTMSGEYMYVRMSPGAHITNASSGYPEVSIPQSSIASALGVNANNMLAGTSIAGVSGNITNRGAWTGSVGTNGTTYIPAGYHNGSGYMNNSQATMGGGTYTPSTSTQTVWCKGKLMTENITFNAIPSGYKDITGGVTVFKSGTRNTTFLPQGFRSVSGWGHNDTVSTGVGTGTTTIITGNSINLSYFRTLKVVSRFSFGSSADRRYSTIYVLSTSFPRNCTNYTPYILKSAGANNGSYSSSGIATIDISSVNQQAYIMITASLYERDSQPYEDFYMTEISLYT